jgi:hypothetical protein
MQIPTAVTAGGIALLSTTYNRIPECGEPKILEKKNIRWLLKIK